ncbi:hypothetical protein O3G_MSEX012626 [Manduca sexta]
MLATITCDQSYLANIQQKIQGVLYINHYGDKLLSQVDRDYFSIQYKWLIVGEENVDLHNIRYDADVTYVNRKLQISRLNKSEISQHEVIHFQDVYAHPDDGVSIHSWAYWMENKFVLTHDRARTLRRLDLKGHPLRIATPTGLYTEETYNGTFSEYLADEKLLRMDSGIRSAHESSWLIIDRLNATYVLLPTLLWSTEFHNNSMFVKLQNGDAELSGAILRVLLSRINRLDYIQPIWPFHVGFSYLAERESSSNMFVEPFAVSVWWACLGMGFILVLAQKVTSRTRMEKDGAFFTVLATCLQQDASAVPEGLSGRWTFIVLSVSSMLVHAYYTSAIVSSLMSTGRSGPETLRDLADSRYAIASEDYDYMRYLFFDVKTNWDDLEYLKKRKMTSKLYQTTEFGVKLVQRGDTAFHGEFNQIYPYFGTFTDDQICKLQYLDTLPESMTWVTTKLRGQWTNVFRSAGYWIQEVGLSKRLVSRLKAPRPSCRAALLAERVKFGDVALLMMLTVFGAVLSLILLGLEILFAKWRKRNTPLVREGSSLSIDSVE